MIASLLAEGAIGVEAYEDDWDTALLPAEAVLVARAGAKRRREFAAGRNCARRALSELGWSDFPILAGTGREPLWPPGVVGSITHCDGYCAAAVAPRDLVQSLGVDAERNRALPDRVRDDVLTPTEGDAKVAGAEVSALIFSAKEAVYKAWYSITGRQFDYLDVAIDFDILARSFSAHLITGAAPVPVLLEAFQGRFAATNEHVFTTILVWGQKPSHANEPPVTTLT